jgi:hypothetical protein
LTLRGKMMIEYIVKLSENQYFRGTILTLVGTIIGVIVTKMTSRMSSVTYSVSTSKMGETATNDIHGKIEVRHRDQMLPNFYFSRVKIQNYSNEDLERIRVLFYVGDGVLILSDFIRYEKEVRLIPYTEDYKAIIANPQNPLLFTRREYEIPVLNRGQSIILELTMTHRTDVGFPYLHASMVHKGAELVEKPYTTEFLGISIRRTLPWAIIIGIILYIFVSLMSLNPWISGGIMIVYGFFAQLLSALLIKSIDRIARKIGISPPIN